MYKQLFSLIGSSILATGITAIATTMSAEAVVFNFDNIESENLNGDAIVNQFSFDVTDAGNNQVLFQFANSGSVDSFVRQIYFEDGNNILSNLGFDAATTSTGVAFEEITKGGLNLAQGKNVNFETSFGIKAVNPGSGNSGIDLNESLGLVFSGDFNTVLADLQSGDLRIGMHVQGIDPNGGSDSFLNNPTGGTVPTDPTNSTDVPEPGVTLALVGVGIAGLRSRRK
jgi:hypothetical protein